MACFSVCSCMCTFTQGCRREWRTVFGESFEATANATRPATEPHTGISAHLPLLYHVCVTTTKWVTQVGHGGYSPCAVALGFPVVCMQHLYERSMDGEKKSCCFWLCESGQHLSRAQKILKGAWLTSRLWRTWGMWQVTHWQVMWPPLHVTMWGDMWHTGIGTQEGLLPWMC